MASPKPAVPAAPGGGADRLGFKFCGLSFASPIVLLSGCVGFGEEYTRIEGFSNRDAGAIVLKGTTGKARLGNPPHRVYETAGGMLNAIGLQNPGVEHVVKNILPQLDFTETRFIANVSGTTIEEYVEVTRAFDESPIDAIEINISCPNVKEGGVAFGNYPDMSAQVVAACRSVTRQAAHHQAVPQPDRHPRERAPLHRGGHGRAGGDQYGHGHGDRRRQPPPGDRQHPGRPLRARDQADRAAEGAPGVRGRTAAPHPDHRPGRHHQRHRCARVHHRRRHRGRGRHRAVLPADDLPQHQRGHQRLPGRGRASPT